MVQFTTAYQAILQETFAVRSRNNIGTRISEATGLKVHRFQSRVALEEIRRLGALIAQNEMDMVVFLHDPLTAPSS